VVLALLREGVGELIIANRTLARAERLVRLALEKGVKSQAIPLSWNELALAAPKGTPLLRHQIPPTALVYDLVYNPLETPLLREAARAGAGILGGIQMLVYQGAASFEMWTGQPAPVSVMLEAATRAMEEISA
jgi:3-dehydroquinate dehydratase/shikimate dehydrogenase